MGNSCSNAQTQPSDDVDEAAGSAPTQRKPQGSSKMGGQNVTVQQNTNGDVVVPAVAVFDSNQQYQQCQLQTPVMAVPADPNAKTHVTVRPDQSNFEKLDAKSKAIPPCKTSSVRAASNAVSVAVPNGMRGGQMMTMQMPSGEVLRVQIPVGLYPGDRFIVSPSKQAEQVQTIYVDGPRPDSYYCPRKRRYYRYGRYGRYYDPYCDPYYDPAVPLVAGMAGGMLLGAALLY